MVRCNVEVLQLRIETSGLVPAELRDSVEGTPLEFLFCLFLCGSSRSLLVVEVKHAILKVPSSSSSNYRRGFLQMALMFLQMP